MSMTRDEAKRETVAAIEAAAEDIYALARDILAHPEPGYREERTAGVVAAAFERLGLAPRGGLALHGVRATLAGRSAGPRAAVLGELDSLIVPDHPHADPITGAAHACGHHGQVAAMIVWPAVCWTAASWGSWTAASPCSAFLPKN